MSHLPSKVLFGAAYYHEYQPDRLEADLDLMRDAHFTVIRVGESVWSTWEPEDGRFDLDWLQPVLDGAHERGIEVVLGTPTYAVPLWLARLYPEIAGERRPGSAMGWGARQEVDFTHPAFRFHAERVIRKIIARYADHPAVIGFQVDNEPGCELLHNHGVFQRFVDHLRHTYGDVETPEPGVGAGLLVAPAVHVGRPVDAGRQRPAAVRPGLARLPGDADHRVHRLAGRHRPRVRPAGPVRHHLHLLRRPAVEDDELTERLDVTAGNPYYRMQDGLALPDRSRRAAVLDDHRHLGAVPERRPDVLLPAGAVPGHRDQRPGHRLPVGQPARPTTASGGRPPGRWSPAAPG